MLKNDAQCYLGLAGSRTGILLAPYDGDPSRNVVLFLHRSLEQDPVLLHTVGSKTSEGGRSRRLVRQPFISKRY